MEASTSHSRNGYKYQPYLVSIQFNLNQEYRENFKGHIRETWLEVPAPHPSGAEDRQDLPTPAPTVCGVCTLTFHTHNRSDLTSFALLLQLKLC